MIMRNKSRRKDILYSHSSPSQAAGYSGKVRDKKVQTKIGKLLNKKMKNTLVVEVKRLRCHPLYKKQIILTNKYHVHCDDVSRYKVGDNITIKQCRPYAKTISWEVINHKVNHKKDIKIDNKITK